MKSTLYVTRNGLLEPLGQSQVLSYLRGISTRYRVTLITYEKPSDLADSHKLIAMQAECKAANIRWLPQRFIQRPRLLMSALSILGMVWMIIREARGQRVCLIHARSYIPATAALLVSRVTGIPFIFDMRALWLEELITAGRLRRNSTLHKVMIVGERACLRHAGAIISLTNASVRYLQEVYSSELRGKKVVVIPTCADLSRFKPIGGTQTEKVVGCLGTLLSGWFRLDWLAEFLRYAASKDLQIRFQITTLDDPELVRAKIGGPADLKSRLEVVACPAHRVHEVLQGQVASVMFYAGGETSELGRCPTRMAEILGCGLPLVANEGVGDVAEIIREYRVGVLMSGPTEEEVAMAWEGLIKLLNDPETGARCRKVAEKFFSLESGTAAFLAVYDSMQGIYQ